MDHQQTSPAETKKHILVMDDEETVQESLRIILNYQGYDVSLASNGEEGLSQIEHGSFDMVILDLKMPDRDGFEILREIRQKYPAIRVIIITGFGTFDIARQALALGAVHYFDKPINLERFILKINKSLTG